MVGQPIKWKKKANRKSHIQVKQKTTKEGSGFEEDKIMSALPHICGSEFDGIEWQVFRVLMRLTLMTSLSCFLHSTANANANAFIFSCLEVSWQLQ